MKTQRIVMLIMAAVISLALMGASRTQPIKVTGTVYDEQGAPLPGVSIVVRGGNTKTVSDLTGKYSIIAETGAELEFSFIGCDKVTVKIISAVIDVTMKASTDQLAEVVVLGYPKEASSLFTGSVSTTSADMSWPEAAYRRPARFNYDGMDAEQYAFNKENRFVNVAKDPLSTFSLEVDGASYSNARRMINSGNLPPKEAVRVEEFVNYFSYDYAAPKGNDPVSIGTEVGYCPWNADHWLVQIKVRAREIPSDDLPPTNFVFLIDVSGSMYGPTRLPLVKQSMKLLINNLRDDDRVAIVTYSGAAGLALPSTPASDRQKIREALDNLTAGGSTAGGAGIKLAYNVARQNFMQNGNNRIILCTDGDFNVGVSTTQGLESLIETERKSGVFLTVLGYGMGNYKDEKLQTLAEKGNGNFGYIDNIQEANRVLVNEFGATMYTVAKDVKLQVEFNPERVESFRLVGYESRLLEHEDFNDDTKDAGELGPGHAVTAFYEIVPKGSSSRAGTIDPLRYSVPDAENLRGRSNGELMYVKLRYKEPDGDTSELMQTAVKGGPAVNPSADFSFASAVVMFGQILSDSDFKGDATCDKVISTARRGLDPDPNGYRREFIRLVESAWGMSM